MGKIWIEICLISARGLRKTSSFWKLQWFAVGWIHPENRYCTKIDASSNANPTWNTKFATLVDDSNFQDMELHVDVYSREPIFLRERLHGNATIVLKEFVAKYSSNSSEASNGGAQVGSYQLRNRSSSKPQGFIDVSIRISEDRGHSSSSFGGNEGEFILMGNNNNTSLSSGGTFPHSYPPEQPTGRPAHFDDAHPIPYQTNHSNPPKATPSYHPPVAGPSYHPPPPAGPSYHPPPSAGSSYHPPPPAGPSYYPSHAPPPPPPPPSNVGYVPTFLPNTDYINMPSSAAAGPGRGGVRPALVGAGAGALAAGAVIFGDDFMSGFNVPGSLPNPTLAISIDPFF